MNEVITGAEAMALLGIRSKNLSHGEQFQRLGITPVFKKKAARGYTLYVNRHDIEGVIAKRAMLRADAESYELGTSEALERIEKKLDRLLHIWSETTKEPA